MNLEYIKVGETYYFPVTVSAIHKSGCIDVKAVEGRYGYKLVPSEVRTLCAIKQGPSSKYDPCRLLRKGDKVQVKRRDGRCNGKDGEYLREAFCTVVEDETRNELVRVLHNCTEYRLDPAYLELIDPVEELEPYFVAYDDKFYHVHKKGEDAALAVYYETKHPHAKEAAEAERDRLNAEYIKELQSNS
jgi:hypothetical protein